MNTKSTQRARRGAVLLAGVSGLALLLAAAPAFAGTTIDNATEVVPTDHPSPWNIDGGLTIGNNGTGELDIISGGDAVTTNANTCGNIFLGFGAGAKGTLKVDGAGSTLDNGSCSLLAGFNGQGVISVTNGGVLTTGPGNNGSFLTSSNTATATATVDGAGSTWNFTGLSTGNGIATINVTNGGLLNQTNCVNMTIATGSTGKGTINVSGAGSHWGNGGGNCGVFLGSSGEGTINVTSGGLVDGILQIVMGSNAGSKGTVLVSGAGSSLSTNGIVVGQFGTGILTVNSGGQLVTVNGGTVGDQTGSTGTVVIDGAGSKWTNGFGGIGVASSGNGSLTLTNGGQISGVSAFVGGNGATGVVLVDGTNSKWANSGAFSVGASNANSTITVSNGGQITDSFATIGNGSNSTTNVTVTGAGSQWINSSTFSLSGSTNATTNFNVLAGAVLSDTTADIQKGTMTVDGAGSTWTNSGNVKVGSSATGVLVLTNGGVVTVGGGSGVLNLGFGSSSNGTLGIGGTGSATAPGTLQAGSIVVGANNGGQGTVIFSHSSGSYNFAIPMSGPGQVKFEHGATNLSGTHTYTGATTVELGATLNLLGSLGATNVTVQNAGFLQGTGSIGGNVTVSNLGRIVGVGGQTLTMGGLTLTTDAIIPVTLGAATATPLFQVNGALTLDGSLQITNAGGFGPGVYRLFNYTGALTDNTLDISTVPFGVNPAKLSIQTGVAGQVNLAYSSAGALQYWNGAVTSPNGSINGGAGTWNTTTTNWTNSGGNATAAWGTDGFAIFQNAAGTVTVSNAGGAVQANGAQFMVTGYTVDGQTLTLTGATPTLRVGDGTGAGANMTATVNAVIAGTNGLIKTDLGKLILGGANTYTSGTTINAGIVQISADNNLGGAGGVTLNGGTLRTTAAFNTSRSFTVGAAGGTIDLGDNMIENGLNGSGALVKTGLGGLQIGNVGNYSGAIDIKNGAVYVNGTIGAASVLVESGGLVGGGGTMGGAITVQDNGTLYGQAGGTFNNGGVSLSPNSKIQLVAGNPTTTAFFQVNGALVLDGHLEVIAINGPGLYRMFNYTGAFTDNGLDVTFAPNGVNLSDLAVQTSVAGQVNLIYSAPAAMTFWNGSHTTANGSVNGGAGTWKAGTTNWTNAAGTGSGAWTNDQFAIFAAPGGAVTVDTSGGALSASGAQFAADGYSMSGGTLTLTGATPTVRVGDGTAGGAAMTTTISTVLAGAGGLIKTDLGTLILAGANTYTGGTTINGGVLQITADANLGGAGGVTLNGGTLRVASTMATSRTFAVQSASTIKLGGNITFDVNQQLSGAGDLTFTGPGLLRFNGGGAYSGTITANGGAMNVGSNALPNANITVGSNGSLQTTTSIGGVVHVLSGGQVQAFNGQLFTVGSLVLDPGSVTFVRLGAPSNTALYQVNGNLTLDGSLNIGAAQGFGPGLYRLMNYTGALTDNGLDLGVLPAGTNASDLSVQTSVAGQVNLVYAAGPIQFWNGSHTTANSVVNGGSGTWKLGTTNWTDTAGATAGPWTNGQIAIFMGPGGAVTVDNSGGAVSASGLQFAANGYSLSGGALTLTGPATLRVGDGTAGGSAYVAAIGSVISGSAGLTKTDLGVLQLSAANTFTGGLTIQAGVVSVAADSALGGGGGAVTLSGGALDVTGAGFATSRTVTVSALSGLSTAAGSTVTLNNGLEGSANLIKSGQGTLTINGAGGFTGGMGVTQGNLVVNGTLSASGVAVSPGAGLSGSGTILGAVTLSDGAHLAGVAGADLDTGSLFLSNASEVDVSLGAPSNNALFVVHGGLTLDGHLNVTDAGGFGLGVYRLIDYTGALTNNGMTLGTIPAGSAGHLSIQTSAANQVNLVYSAQQPIQFWNGSTTAPDGIVHGGAGTWRAGDTNWTDAGGASASAWNGVDAVFMGTGGAVVIDNSGGQISANSIQFASNGYSVTGGSLLLTGGPTVIRVGDGTAAGANFNAVVVAALNGSGGLGKTDLGALTLSGVNGFTGGLIIQGGQVIVSADTALGAAGGGVTLDGGALTAGGSFASGRDVSVGVNGGGLNAGSGVTLTLGGLLQGVATVHKGGAGTVALAGDSSGSYGGLIQVDAGALMVDGKVGGAVQVNSGARLKGHGQVGATAVATGGTLAPGNSIGTITVAGDLTLATGSTYEVELNAAGQSDLTHVTGTASINGGAILTAQPAAGSNYVLGTRYTVLTADVARSGTFGTFNGATLAQPFLKLAPAYDSKHVYIDVTRNAASFCSVTVTANQCAAAGGAESLGQGDAVYNAVANVPDAAAANAAFDLLSGEGYASARGVMTEDIRFVRDAAAQRLLGGDQGGAGWAQVFGADGHWDGDGNAAKAQRSVAGFLLGGDWRVGDGLRLGVLAGYSRDSFKVADRRTSGDIDSYHLGVYGGREAGAWRVTFGAAYAWHDLTFDRQSAFGGTPSDSAKGYTGQLFGEAGYRFGGDGAGVTPFVAVAAVDTHANGSVETGGATALRVLHGSTQTTFATVGLRGDWTHANDGGGESSFRGVLAWRTAGGDKVPDARMAFASGGSAFTVKGAPIGDNVLVVGADLSLAISPRARAAFTYDGQFGDGTQDQSVKASLKIAF